VALRGARGRALAGALALYGKGCAAAAASPLPSLGGVTLMHVPVVSLGRLGGAEWWCLSNPVSGMPERWMLSRVSCMCLWRGAAESREHIRHIGAMYLSPAVSDLPAADISFGVELTRGPRPRSPRRRGRRACRSVVCVVVRCIV